MWWEENRYHYKSTMATFRLTKEAERLASNPPEYIYAKPEEDNLFQFHYVLLGPPETPYAGGIYHGVLVFPENYPFKPPAIKMFTPNGRFEVNKRLCVTMSDYHPETWSPLWNVDKILMGLLSFMTEDGGRAIGSIKQSDADCKKYAKESLEFNMENPIFASLFGDILDALISHQTQYLKKD